MHSFLISIFIFILFMELVKNNLITIQVVNSPIQRNFQLIQKEFAVLHQIVALLKIQNTTINSNVTECMTFIKNIQNSKSKHQQKVYLTNFLSEQNQIPVVQIKKTESQTVNFGGQMLNKKESHRQELQQNQQIQQFQQKMLSSSILKDVTNMQQSKVQMIISIEQKHQQLIRSKTKKLSIFNQGRMSESSQKGKDDLAFIQNKLRIFEKNLLQQIQDLNKQLFQFRQTQSVFKSKIQVLQKQNQTVKKLLGIKKKGTTIPKKEGQKSEDTFIKSRKKLQSRGKISLKSIHENGAQTGKNSQNNITINENNSDINQDDGEQNGLLLLNKQIDKIRDYLNGKMKAIDQNFNLVNINIQKIERNMQILQRVDYELKQDLESLGQTCNETKLNLGQINERTMVKSRYRSNDILRDQSKNSQNGAEPFQFEDRIIQLLDQMEKLKSEYSLLFDRKEQEGTNNQQLTEQVMQKRKKLALKLNSNCAVDEKTKKQLTSVRRDLKRLRDQFDLLMNGVNTGSHETKTLIIKPNESKQDWKSLTTKIYKTRQELMSIIKELQTKIVANNDLTVVLNEMEVGIGQCKILLKKKVDIVQFEKTTKRIQSRLNNFIKQTFEKEGYTNQQDAMITKQPWFCLSCDIELKTYTGKINKTIGNSSPSVQKPMGKKVNPESHMVRRNQNGRLPSLAI